MAARQRALREEEEEEAWKHMLEQEKKAAADSKTTKNVKHNNKVDAIIADLQRSDGIYRMAVARSTPPRDLAVEVRRHRAAVAKARRVLEKSTLDEDVKRKKFKLLGRIEDIVKENVNTVTNNPRYYDTDGEEKGKGKKKEKEDVEMKDVEVKDVEVKQPPVVIDDEITINKPVLVEKGESGGESEMTEEMEGVVEEGEEKETEKENKSAPSSSSEAAKVNTTTQRQEPVQAETMFQDRAPPEKPEGAPENQPIEEPKTGLPFKGPRTVIPPEVKTTMKIMEDHPGLKRYRGKWEAGTLQQITNLKEAPYFDLRFYTADLKRLNNTNIQRKRKNFMMYNPDLDLWRKIRRRDVPRRHSYKGDRIQPGNKFLREMIEDLKLKKLNELAAKRKEEQLKTLDKADPKAGEPALEAGGGKNGGAV